MASKSFSEKTYCNNYIFIVLPSDKVAIVIVKHINKVCQTFYLLTVKDFELLVKNKGIVSFHTMHNGWVLVGWQ